MSPSILPLTSSGVFSCSQLPSSLPRCPLKHLHSDNPSEMSPQTSSPALAPPASSAAEVAVPKDVWISSIWPLTGPGPGKTVAMATWHGGGDGEGGGLRAGGRVPHLLDLAVPQDAARRAQHQSAQLLWRGGCWGSLPARLLLSSCVPMSLGQLLVLVRLGTGAGERPKGVASPNPHTQGLGKGAQRPQ